MSKGLSIDRRADGSVRVFGQAYGQLEGRSGSANRNYSGLWSIDVLYDASHNVVQDLFFLTTPEIRSLRSPLTAAANFGERTLLWGYGQGELLTALTEDGISVPSSGPGNLDGQWSEHPLDGGSLFLPGLVPDIVFSPDLPSNTPGVPEPAEWALLGFGLLGLGLGYYRKVRPARA